MNMYEKKYSEQSAQYKLLLNEFLSAENELSDLRQILHCAPEAILITNSAKEIIYVNPAWEVLTGYSFAEVQSKNPNMLESGKTPRSVYKQLCHNLKQNLPFTYDGFIEKRKDGSEFTAHSTIFPVLRFNSPVYYVQFLYDITDKKKEELERRELLSFVSHELKSPITVLKLLLTNRMKTKKPFSVHDLELMNKELDRLTALINESLDISRIDSDRFYLNLSYFDLNTLIEEVFEQITVILDGHKIVVETTPDLIVLGDYNRIKQVLINLLTNAIKYSQIGTTITLTAKKRNKNVVVSVSDQGIGISSERLPFIFQKFFQVRKNTTEGLGLGLYISAEIIKKHQGKIWVTSQPEKGSTFYFSLPQKNDLHHLAGLT